VTINQINALNGLFFVSSDIESMLIIFSFKLVSLSKLVLVLNVLADFLIPSITVA